MKAIKIQLNVNFGKLNMRLHQISQIEKNTEFGQKNS